MIDMQSISLAFGSLNSVTNIVKGLSSLKTMAEVQSKAIELNQQIINLQ